VKIGSRYYLAIVGEDGREKSETKIMHTFYLQNRELRYNMELNKRKMLPHTENKLCQKPYQFMEACYVLKYSKI